jgi:long-chain acyl-CoA synthetase
MYNRWYLRAGRFLCEDRQGDAMTKKLETLQTLIDRFSGSGNRPAILAFQSDKLEHWSYAELLRSVERLSAGLADAGIGRGETVALIAGNRPEWVIAALAVINAGAVLVPVDVQLVDDVVDHVLRDSEARFVFTIEEQVPRLERLAPGGECRFILLDADSPDERGWRALLPDRAKPPKRIDANDTAVLFYTSGTTGPPKGVPLTHRNFVFELNAMLQTDLAIADNSVLVPLPLHHVFPFVVGMLAGLASGSVLVFPQALTGPQILRALREGGITTVIGVPRLYSALFSGIEARAAASGRVAAASFRAVLGLSTWLRQRLGLKLGRRLLDRVHREIGPAVRILSSGGAKLDIDLAWKLEGLGWRVCNGYGLTETAPILSVNTLGDCCIGSTGRPLPGVQIVIDRVAGKPGEERSNGDSSVEPDQEGEILAKGPNVFSGYRHLPEETEKAFTVDGWFRTGDLGYFDRDGFLYVTGRVSTVIVTESGENIQPDAVEDIYQEHPMIREIAVLEQNRRLVALIVPEIAEMRQRGYSDIAAAVRDAIQECSGRLPTYQRISDYAVTRDALARTGLGKIRRHLLRDRYRTAKELERAPQQAAVKPMSLVEMTPEDRALLENPVAMTVWNWLTGRFSDVRLTPDTSPQLDLGVDSIEWLNLSLEIRRCSGVELTEAAISRIDTIRDLLQEVAETSAEGELVIEEEIIEHPKAALSDRQRRWLDPPGPIRSLLARGMFACSRLIVRVLFRLQVKGTENLPRQGPFVLVPNHLSYLDPPTVAAALDAQILQQTYWPSAVGVIAENPLVRVISWVVQMIPVDAAGSGASSLAFGAAVLKRGQNLVWFAEGQRSTSGRLQSFKPGLGILLKYFDIPVVPVFIRGTHEAMSPGRLLPRPKPLTIVFGEPMNARDLEALGAGDEPAERIMKALHDRVAELATQLQQGVRMET